MIRPKRVLLDTCAVAGLARGLRDVQGRDYAAARRLLRLSEEGAWIPVLCLEILAELTAHADEAEVTTRAQLLESFPYIAWIRRRSGDERLSYCGSTLDLVFNEAWELIQHPGFSTEALLDAGREASFGVASFSQVIGRELLGKIAIGEHVLGSKRRARGMETLTRALRKNELKQSLGALRARATRDPEQVARNMRALIQSVRQVASEERDRRLDDIDLANGVRKLEVEIHADVASVSRQAGNPMDNWLMQFGLDPRECPNSMTIAQVRERWLFRWRLQLLFERRGVEAQLPRALNLRPERLPSYYLAQLVRDRQLSGAVRAEGSDLVDADVASLAHYVDVAVIDKRTREYLGQIRRKHPAVGRAMGRLVAWNSTGELLRALTMDAPAA